MKFNRVLCVINKPTREIPVFEKIKRELIIENPNCEVNFIEYRDENFLVKSLQYKPELIITFPFTSVGTSQPFYILKLLLQCVIACFRTEGNISFYSEQQINWLVGMDHYGPDLVDMELFWGKRTADVVGEKLLNKNKVFGLDRIFVTGYPPLEDFFTDKKYDTRNSLPGNIKKKLEKFIKKNTYLFITGFHLSDYSADDLMRAGDCFDPTADNYEQELSVALDGIEKSKLFRKLWIENIIKSAVEFPEDLFIVKCHPIEWIIHERNGYDPYAVFNKYYNILYIYEDVTIPQLLNYCSLFFHYGSTALADAYLLNVPSIFVSSQELYNGGHDYTLPNYYYTDMGWTSNKSCDIKNLCNVIKEQKKSPITFNMTPRIKKILFDIFNITESNLGGNNIYNPANTIVRILKNLPDNFAQKINEKSEYFINSANTFVQYTLQFYCQMAEQFSNKNNFREAAKHYDESLFLLLKTNNMDVSIKYLYAYNLFNLKELYLVKSLLNNEFDNLKKDKVLIDFDSKVKEEFNNYLFKDILQILNNSIIDEKLINLFEFFKIKNFINTLADAEKFLSKIESFDDNFKYQLHSLIGFTFIFVENYDLAKKHLEIALTFNKNLNLPLLGLIELELLNNSFELAYIYCKKVINSNQFDEYSRKKLNQINSTIDYVNNNHGIAELMKS